MTGPFTQFVAAGEQKYAGKVENFTFQERRFLGYQLKNKNGEQTFIGIRETSKKDEKGNPIMTLCKFTTKDGELQSHKDSKSNDPTSLDLTDEEMAEIPLEVAEKLKCKQSVISAQDRLKAKAPSPEPSPKTDAHKLSTHTTITIRQSTLDNSLLTIICENGEASKEIKALMESIGIKEFREKKEDPEKSFYIPKEALLGQGKDGEANEIAARFSKYSKALQNSEREERDENHIFRLSIDLGKFRQQQRQ